MADRHSIAHRVDIERVRKLVGGQLRAGSELFAGVWFYEHHLAVEDVCIFCKEIRYFFGGVGGENIVTCIHKPDKIACSGAETFVHCIVESIVFFADGIVYVRGILSDDFGGFVRRKSVNNDIFDVGVGLVDNALYGSFEGCLGVISNGDNRDGFHTAKIMPFFEMERKKIKRAAAISCGGSFYDFVRGCVALFQAEMVL